MPDLNIARPSWQDINTKLSSPEFKRMQLYLGTAIFWCSCFILFLIAMLSAPDWGKRIDLLMGVGSRGAKSIMFFMTGIFLSPYLIGWPFWKLRQTLLQPLLMSESLSEWLAIRNRAAPIFIASFVIQIIIGYLITTYSYYFFIN